MVLVYVSASIGASVNILAAFDSADGLPFDALGTWEVLHDALLEPRGLMAIEWGM